jgi:hypothetical protein
MRLVVAASLVIVLAGCGGATGASLEDAADATGEETSGVELAYRFKDGEREYEFKSNGVFDYPNERGVMTTSSSVPFFGKDVDLREVRLLGNVGYMRWEVKGKTYWLRQEPVEKGGDPAEVLIPGPGTPTKPTEVLSRVLLASDENDEVGKEEIRGTDTTHYRARVDLTKLVKQLPPNERPDEDVEMLWGGRYVPVDLWIDDESRLRRITMTRPGVGEDEAAELRIAVDLFDYGIDVNVEAPPRDDTISQDEFVRIIGPVIEATSDAGEGVGGVCTTTPNPKKADRECLEQKTP